MTTNTTNNNIVTVNNKYLNDEVFYEGCIFKFSPSMTEEEAKELLDVLRELNLYCPYIDEDMDEEEREEEYEKARQLEEAIEYIETLLSLSV